MDRPRCLTCFCYDGGFCRYSPVDQPPRFANDSCSQHQDFEQWKLFQTSNVSLDAATFDSFFTLTTCLNGFLYGCLNTEENPESIFAFYQLYKVRLMDLKVKAEEKLVQ
jgi:hypothetical protein